MKKLLLIFALMPVFFASACCIPFWGGGGEDSSSVPVQTELSQRSVTDAAVDECMGKISVKPPFSQFNGVGYTYGSDWEYLVFRLSGGAEGLAVFVPAGKECGYSLSVENGKTYTVNGLSVYASATVKRQEDYFGHSLRAVIRLGGETVYFSYDHPSSSRQCDVEELVGELFYSRGQL